MTDQTTTYCATHPDVESNLQCSRCGTYICPRCLVHTPVGARCRSCANLRRPPMYEVGPLLLARAFAAAAGLGILVGIVWGVVFASTQRFFGFFIIFVALGLGYVFAEVIGWAANRKRGPLMQIAAVAGVILAYLVRNAVLGVPLVLVNDLFGIIVVGVAAAWAIRALR